jgi:Zn ribbon nucleic-acid-binding protein
MPKPFNSGRCCAKCKSFQITVCYNEDADILSCKCRCGFAWNETPADKEEDNNVTIVQLKEPKKWPYSPPN